MSDDLVKRLRKKRERCHDLSGVYWTEDMDCQEAADRIEELEAKLAGVVEALETIVDNGGAGSYHLARTTLAKLKGENT